MSKVKGATHYAVKQFSRGGPVDAPTNAVKTERMPSGAQQYVRGKDVMDKLRTTKSLEGVLLDADRKASGRPDALYGKASSAGVKAGTDELRRELKDNYSKQEGRR